MAHQTDLHLYSSLCMYMVALCLKVLWWVTRMALSRTWDEDEMKKTLETNSGYDK